MASTPEAGNELWKSDGSEAGTRLVQNYTTKNVGSFSSDLTQINGALYFAGSTTQTGDALWRTDGTFAGTSIAFDPDDSGAVQPFSSQLTNVGGRLFYLAASGTASSSIGLWVLDDAVGPTPQLVTHIRGGHSPVVFDLHSSDASALYFSVDDELWYSDGTGFGTINLHATGAIPSDLRVRELIDTPNNGAYSTSGRTEVWRTNGTASGSRRVDVIPYLFDNIWAESIGSAVVFLTSRFQQADLWVVAGDSFAKSIISAAYLAPWESSDRPLIAFHGSIVFVVATLDRNQILIRHDPIFGTSSEIWSSTGNGSNTGHIDLKQIGYSLYFVAGDSTSGASIWKLDGSSTGTTSVAEFDPSEGDPSNFRVLSHQDRVLVFGAKSHTASLIDRSSGQISHIDSSVDTSRIHAASLQVVRGIVFGLVAGRNYFSNNLMAITGEPEWTNPQDPLDIDDRNGITPLDALLVINELSSSTVRNAETGALPDDRIPWFYWDVNNDSLVTLLDALLVINALPQSTSAQVEPHHVVACSNSLQFGTRRTLRLRASTHRGQVGLGAT